MKCRAGLTYIRDGGVVQVNVVKVQVDPVVVRKLIRDERLSPAFGGWNFNVS